jgi:hypothetical protein
MASKELTDRLSSNADDIWKSIDKVTNLSRDLGDELAKEYRAFLQTLGDILDEWSHRL